MFLIRLGGLIIARNIECIGLEISLLDAGDVGALTIG